MQTLSVRRASPDDIGHILSLGAAFHASSVWAESVPYDRRSFEATVRAIIGGAGAIFVSDKGFCGGVTSPVYFNAHVKIAAELFWYTQDSHGQELHATFERWAKDTNHSFVHMTGQINEREKGIRRLFESRDYTAQEINFFKAF